jgi:hypothetical protein
MRKVLHRLCVVFAFSLAARGQEPMTFFRESFIGSNFFAAFVPPSATQWVRVEVSTDLTNWTERAQAIATRAHLFADEGAADVPRRFFGGRGSEPEIIGFGSARFQRERRRHPGS